jgi:3-dehydroquinate dehydratase II
MAKLLLINGPNLNLLGTREPETYGRTTLADIEQSSRKLAASLGHELDCYQSNHEGAIVDRIQAIRLDQTAFVIINPGAYTHTSVAIRDALLGVSVPFIEIHISNVFAREDFRRHSYLTDVAVGIISGLGTAGYEMAIRAAAARLAANNNK